MQEEKRFSNEKAAQDFAAKVKGEVRDLRNQPKARCKFKVIYYSKKKNKYSDWCPEEGRDFGYPNEYWQ